MTAGPVWERQPGETDKAYAAFRMFRDMHPSSREMKAAALAAGYRSVRAVEAWAKRYAWTDRCAAYDAWVDTIRRDERERGFREDERLKFQRRRDLVETELTIVTKAMERVSQGLQGPMWRQKIVGEDGHITIIEPTRWTFRDLIAAFTLADRRGRLALEMFGDAARAPTPEPEGAGTTDVERYVEGLVAEALEEADSTNGQ